MAIQFAAEKPGSESSPQSPQIEYEDDPDLLDPTDPQAPDRTSTTAFKMNKDDPSEKEYDKEGDDGTGEKNKEIGKKPKPILKSVWNATPYKNRSMQKRQSWRDKTCSYQSYEGADSSTASRSRVSSHSRDAGYSSIDGVNASSPEGNCTGRCKIKMCTGEAGDTCCFAPVLKMLRNY